MTDKRLTKGTKATNCGIQRRGKYHKVCHFFSLHTVRTATWYGGWCQLSAFNQVHYSCEVPRWSRSGHGRFDVQSASTSQFPRTDSLQGDDSSPASLSCSFYFAKTSPSAGYALSSILAARRIRPDRFIEADHGLTGEISTTPIDLPYKD